MAASSQILVNALLVVAKQQPDPLAWIVAKHAAAAEAVLAGAEFVSENSFEGTSAKAIQNIPAPQLLEMLELVRARYEAELTFGTDNQIPGGAYFAGAFTRV